MGFQPSVFQCQVTFFQGVAKQLQEFVVIKRLFDKIVGALLHGGDGRADIALPGQNNHRDGVILGANPVEHFQAIHPRHVVVT